MIFNRKGQNTAEYAIVIGLVIGAMIAMQTYVKRGVQGRVKQQTDKFDTNAGWAVAIAGAGGNGAPQAFEKYNAEYIDSKNTKKSVGEVTSKMSYDAGGAAHKVDVDVSSAGAADYRTYTYDPVVGQQ